MIENELSTCSCPRTSTPSGLMGWYGARFSPLPRITPSWKASHIPSRVVHVMQRWCHFPSLMRNGSFATCSGGSALVTSFSPVNSLSHFSSKVTPRLKTHHFHTFSSSCWITSPVAFLFLYKNTFWCSPYFYSISSSSTKTLSGYSVSSKWTIL